MRRGYLYNYKIKWIRSNSGVSMLILERKISQMLSHEDFEYLVIETEQTYNHINRMVKKTEETYCWVIEYKSEEINVLDDQMVRSFFCSESLINEMNVWLSRRKEVITRVQCLLMIA